MTSEWPFVAIRDDGDGMAAGNRWDLFKAYQGKLPPETLFIREDAARAWQAFRDWLNGSVEQWQQYAESMYAYGRQLGWEDV